MRNDLLRIRRAIGTVSLLWLGSLAGAGLAFFTQVLLARELTAANYGLFAAALATATLLAPLAGFGIPGVWLKVFGAEGLAAKRWLPASFRFVALTTTATLTLYFAWSAWGPHDESTSDLLFSLSPIILGYLFMETVVSKLLLEERFHLLAIWQALPHFARLALLAIILFHSERIPDITAIAAAYASVAIVVSAIGFVQLRTMSSGGFALKGHLVNSESKPPAKDVELTRVADIAPEAWPFGLATVFHLIYFQIAIVFLKYMTNSEQVGFYNVAFTIMAAVYLLPSVIFQKFMLPKLHRWAVHDRKMLHKAYRQGNITMSALGIATMLALSLSASWLIPLLFGDEYSQSAELLMILSISAPFIFIASSVGAVLVTQDHMIRKVRYMGMTAVLNVALNFLLIPSFQATGAAFASVLSNAALLILYYAAAERFVFCDDLTVTPEHRSGS